MSKEIYNHGKALYWLNKYAKGLMCFNTKSVKEKITEYLDKKGFSDVADVFLYNGTDRNELPVSYICIQFEDGFSIYSDDIKLAGRGPLFKGSMNAKEKHWEEEGWEY